MPGVKPLNTDELLAELAAVSAEIHEVETRVRELAARRDAYMIAATRAGASRRRVATAARLTAGRVQQIIAAAAH
jgi:hypothetical protein